MLPCLWSALASRQFLRNARVVGSDGRTRLDDGEAGGRNYEGIRHLVFDVKPLRRYVSANVIVTL